MHKIALFAAMMTASLPSALAQAPVSALPGDRLEPGLQGQSAPEDAQVLAQPYHKGVDLVGHLDLKRTGNMVLSVIDRCAYVSSVPAIPIPGMVPTVRDKAGVAIIDVRRPAAPRLAGMLTDKGSIDAAETMDAVSAEDRKVLVAGAYAGGKAGSKPGDVAWLDVYDAHDCLHPKLMAEYHWPENVHMVTLSPNGRRVYGTSIDPFTGKGGLLVLDIADPAHPRFIGKFAATAPDGRNYEFAPHQVTFSPDERRIYAGVIGSTGGDLNQEVKLFPPNAKGLGPEAGGIYILDNSEIVDGRADPKLRLIGTAEHAGWHSPVRASFGGKPYLVSAGELGACPGAWPRITSIAEEKHPQVVGEFRLQMNQAQNCPAWGPIEKATNGISGGPGTAASHFNAVDRAEQTRLGLFNFMFAGLRIVDLRDPAHPAEIAYFKPGDACMSNVQYLPSTHEIWFDCFESGFYIVKLRPGVLRAAHQRRQS